MQGALGYEYIEGTLYSARGEKGVRCKINMELRELKAAQSALQPHGREQSQGK
jgi:hypothetical protein